MNFLVSKEKITQEKADEIMGKITTGLNNICGECDLIVEVALEKMEIKQAIFKELQGIVKKECMFASNTSSLSITKIGEGLDRPMIGMHFFNPADRMKLVEVIRGENTRLRGKQNSDSDDQRGNRRSRCRHRFCRGYRCGYAARRVSSYGSAAPWRSDRSGHLPGNHGSALQ